MPRRARLALAGAAAGVVLLALTWYLAHYVGLVQRVDVNILLGFAELNRPGLNRLTLAVASLCDPHQYIVLACIPVLVALLRRRVRVAVMIVIVLLGANETTELLKPLLAAPRDAAWMVPISAASWPSGHATASMSLALCLIVAAPSRWRPAVAAAMAAFSVAVCYSFLELGWHYPSDVLGGYLVAATWMLLGIAGLSIYNARRPAPRAHTEPRRQAPTVGQALTPVAALLVGVGVCAGLILIARPAPVIDYARGHETFVLGAAAIGTLGLVLASGLTFLLQQRG